MKRAPIKVFFLTACFAFGGLAGCMGPVHSNGALLIFGSSCEGALAQNCRIIDGIMRVSDITIGGDGPEATGIQIDALTVPVLIDHVSIHDVAIGISISETCLTCTIQIRSLRVAASETGIAIGLGGPARAKVSLTASNVTGTQSGTTETGSGGERVGTDSLGIVTYDDPGGLELDHVRISSPTPSFGWALWDRGGTMLDARSLHISGFGRGIIGNWTYLRLTDVRVDCIYDAIWASNLPEVQADGLDVSGCMRTIPGCGDRCQPAILLAGKLGKKGPTAHFDHLRLANNTWGLSIGEYASVELRAFNVTGGVVGVTIVMADSLSMENGRIGENEQQGAVVGVDRLAINRVTFDNNGRGRPGNGNHAGLDVRARAGNVGAGTSPRLIRNSTFVGNVPFGVIADPDVPLDASYNWWGSMLGASPPTPAAAGNPRVPGFGDMTAGAVVTEPHLVSPP